MLVHLKYPLYEPMQCKKISWLVATVTLYSLTAVRDECSVSERLCICTQNVLRVFDVEQTPLFSLWLAEGGHCTIKIPIRPLKMIRSVSAPEALANNRKSIPGTQDSVRVTV